MNLAEIGKRVLRFLLHAISAIYEKEMNLIFNLVAEVKCEGLTGDEARKEVFRRFREKYVEEIKDSLLNFLIEAAVVATKG